MELSQLTDFSWLGDSGLERLPDFLTSLAIGLLMGLERERNPSARAGLRTFAIVALFGGVCGVLSQEQNAPWLSVIGMAAVAAVIIAAYLDRTQVQDDPGTTTSAALVLCFTLGVLVTYGYDRIAVMLAIAATILLYFKPELHGLAKRLERLDLVSILQFATVALIILPIVPDRDLGPYGAINPRQIWMMVVLISGVSLAGYLGLRLVGNRYGGALLGVLGGLVSSTATSLVYARNGRATPKLRPLCCNVILLANLVVLARLAVLAAAVAPAVLPRLLPVLGCALVPGAAFILYRMHKVRGGDDSPTLTIANPTELRTALAFAAMYGVILVLSAWLYDKAGAAGVYGVALVSGLTDVDAITLSSLRLVEIRGLGVDQAVISIALAYLANIGFKMALVLVVGGIDMFRGCLAGFVLTAAGIGLGLMLFG